MKKVVRFYKPVIVERDESTSEVPRQFWASAHQVITEADAAQRRFRVNGTDWFGDGGTGHARALNYIRSGQVRRRGENPSVLNDHGEVVPLALADGNLFETAYLVPFGTAERVAMVGPLRGLASRSAIEMWLTIMLDYPSQGRSLRLVPLIDENLAAKLERSIGASRLSVTIPAGAEIEVPEDASEIEKALHSADATEEGDLDVTMTWSFGRRKKEGGMVNQMLDVAKRLRRQPGVSRLEVTLMLPGPKDDGSYRTEVHELIEDRISITAEFPVEPDVQVEVDDMLEGMHNAIEQYRRPDTER